MAFHKHVKLPPLRFTRRCGSDVQVGCVHRGASVRSQAADPGTLDDNEDSVIDSDAIQQCEECNPLSNEPSDHQLHGEASVRAWEKLRTSMLLNAVESHAMAADQICLCCSKLAVFRCQECGPMVYYCFECFSKQHERVNVFHIAEKWEVSNI